MAFKERFHTPNKGGGTITFLMPCIGNVPSGGFKVVYEYANRLVFDGYNVNIVYPVKAKISRISFINRLRLIKRYLIYKRNGYSCKTWFKLDSRVNEILVFSLNPKHVPKSEIYIATAISTAYCLKDYPDINAKKLYLIQGFENWDVNDDVVYESYRLGYQNIVVSDWLAEKVKQAGVGVTVIKNGFDFNYFKLSNPIEPRNKFIISMLYHRSHRKGCEIGFQALEILKKSYPQLRVMLFGTPLPPSNLPDWIEYYQNPDKETHNKIYNNSSIYLAPSLQEGWGLTVGEAMICGCAVVCTDTLGFKEMIKDGVNGLIAPIGDSDSLANNISRLFEDDKLRIQLAERGNKYIQRFNWDTSYRTLKNLIRENS